VKEHRAQIPELDFEIPSNTQRGTMTTVRCGAWMGSLRARRELTRKLQVEGLLASAAENLRMLQSERRAADAQLAGAR